MMFERTEVDNIGIWQDDLLKKHQELLHAFSERGKDGNFNLALLLIYKQVISSASSCPAAYSGSRSSPTKLSN